jgi:RNase P/RNase MRP subunit p30
VVDKVEARKNLNNAKAVEVVLAHLLNNYGGNAESFLRATKNELQTTRKCIDGLKVLLK